MTSEEDHDTPGEVPHTFKQAVLILRWFLDDARMTALARDNGISTSTAYEYRDEGITALAARKPSLHSALLAAKAARGTGMDRLWTVEDVSVHLDVPVKTPCRWRVTGYGPEGRQVGKYLRYKPQVVIAWFDALTDPAA